MKLVVLTSPKALANEQEYLHEMCAAGLELVHLRKPDYSRREMEDWLGLLDEEWHQRVVIHSHYDLCKSGAFRGIHLTEQARMEYGGQGVNGDSLRKEFVDCTCSASYHDLDQLLSTSAAYDYVFLSPVFDSISKQGLRAAFGEEELSRTLRKMKTATVALGGVSLGRLSKIRELGFAGAAVLGAVWENSDPVGSFCKLKERCIALDEM